MKTKQLLLALILALSIIGCNNSSSSSLHTESLNTNKTTFLPTKNPPIATQKDETTIMQEARLSGVLKKDKQGCLRVNNDLIIWPYGSKLKNNLIYNKENNLIAVIGESVIFGGGEVSSKEDSEETIKRISKDLPNPKCPDPYFFVDSVI